jgi:hypothetical protein
VLADAFSALGLPAAASAFASADFAAAAFAKLNDGRTLALSAEKTLGELGVAAAGAADEVDVDVAGGGCCPRERSVADRESVRDIE